MTIGNFVTNKSLNGKLSRRVNKSNRKISYFVRQSLLIVGCILLKFLGDAKLQMQFPLILFARSLVTVVPCNGNRIGYSVCLDFCLLFIFRFVQLCSSNE